MIGLSLIAIATFLSRKYGYGAAVSFSWRSLFRNFVAAIPALGAPVIILGGILGGIFTATESAAAAVFYSMIVGFFIHRELEARDLSPIFIEGSIIAAIVMFIIATASIFSWVAAIDDIPGRLAGSLLMLSENPVILLLLINLPPLYTDPAYQRGDTRYEPVALDEVRVRTAVRRWRRPPAGGQVVRKRRVVFDRHESGNLQGRVELDLEKGVITGVDAGAGKIL